MAMTLSNLFVILVGFLIVILSVSRAPSANWGAALGVFLIFLGFHGLTSMRIQKLEKAVKEMQERSQH